MNFSISNNNLIFLGKLFLTSMLIWLIFRETDIPKFIEITEKVNFYYLLQALFVFFIQYLIATFRWRIISISMGIRSNFFNFLKIFWIGIFFNQALPSNIGGDAFRIFKLNKLKKGILVASACVFIDRVFGLFFLGLILGISLIFTSLTQENDIFLLTSFTLSLIVFLGGLILMLADHLPYVSRFEKFYVLIKHISTNIRKLMIENYFRNIVSITSICIHLLTFLIFVFLSQSLNIEIYFSDLVFVISLMLIASAIPISIAGWGVREGIIVFSLSFLGISSEEALSLSILYGLLLIISSIPGLFFWSASKRITNYE